MKPMLSEKQVCSEFEAIVPELEKWGSVVDNVLKDYLKTAFPSGEHLQNTPTFRVKGVKSYCEKVLYRKPTDNPLLNTWDKVGTRVVVLTRKDVEQVSEFIENCTDWIIVDKTRNYNEEIFKDPEIFSYQSDHYIVKPLNSYDTSVDRRLLTCEIQIRTLLMHAYAEISHDTVYKKASFDNPKAKRLLATSMALLEAADEKFIQIYDEMDNMNTFYYSLQKTLIGIYKECVPDYNENDYNTEIAKKALSIYTIDEQHKIAEEIGDFYNDQKEEIKSQINYYKDKSILFCHPIVLVSLYGIQTFQNRTWSSWPFSDDSIEAVTAAMNISIDSLK